MAFANPYLIAIINASQEVCAYFVVDDALNSTKGVVNWNTNDDATLFG